MVIRQVLYFGWLFASQKTGYPGFRYRFIPTLRFGTGFASPYYPCHGLKKGQTLFMKKRKVLFFKQGQTLFLLVLH
ncbi:MAG: hypothetical protein PUJ82_11870 [Spirochaetales bacterium]|nr:hypothetical protein [Spirochaetales bacterium]